MYRFVGLWASNKKVQKDEDGSVSPPYSLPLVAP